MTRSHEVTSGGTGRRVLANDLGARFELNRLARMLRASPGVPLYLALIDLDPHAYQARLGRSKETHQLIVMTIQGAIAFYYFPQECEIGFDAATRSIIGQRTQRPLLANPYDTRGGRDRDTEKWTSELEKLPLPSVAGLRLSSAIRKFFASIELATAASRNPLCTGTNIEPVVLFGRQRQECLAKRALYCLQKFSARLLFLSLTLSFEHLDQLFLQREQRIQKRCIGVIVNNAGAGAWRQIYERRIDVALKIPCCPRRFLQFVHTGNVFTDTRAVSKQRDSIRFNGLVHVKLNVNVAARSANG